MNKKSRINREEYIYSSPFTEKVTKRPFWKLLPTNHQLLLHDGSSNSTIIAPAFCQPKTPDYAIEARIQNIGQDNFGLIARGGYTGKSNYYRADIDADSYSICDQTLTANYSGYHTYRLEVKGNEIHFLIDSSIICSATDNLYLSPGQVGLVSTTQIEVIDFKVVIL